MYRFIEKEANEKMTRMQTKQSDSKGTFNQPLLPIFH